MNKSCTLLIFFSSIVSPSLVITSPTPWAWSFVGTKYFYMEKLHTLSVLDSLLLVYIDWVNKFMYCFKITFFNRYALINTKGLFGRGLF